MFSNSLAALALMGVLRIAHATNSFCKSIPGDPGWPTSTKWEHLNKTIDGRLIKTVPLGSVCHKTPFGDYNEAECQDLKAAWDETAT